jgi:quercetin dioxygenase-like cupin family protein
MSRTPMERSQFVTGVVEDLPITSSATTSRTLIDNDATRVVIFAFDAGEELTEHTASRPVVVQLLDGAVRFQVAGRDAELYPGDCVYLAAGDPHALQALEPSRLSLVFIQQTAGS